MYLVSHLYGVFSLGVDLEAASRRLRGCDNKETLPERAQTASVELRAENGHCAMRCIRVVTSGHFDSRVQLQHIWEVGWKQTRSLFASGFNEATTERGEKQRSVNSETHIGRCADHLHLAAKSEKIKNSKQTCWISSGIYCHAALLSFLFLTT